MNKKFLIVISLITVLIVGLFVLTGCGNTTTTTENKNETTKETTTSKEEEQKPNQTYEVTIKDLTVVYDSIESVKKFYF